MRTEVGLPFRIERDGIWMNLDILKLTKEEIQKQVLEYHDLSFAASVIMVLTEGLKESYENEATRYTELRDWEGRFKEAEKNLKRIVQAIDALDIDIW